MGEGVGDEIGFFTATPLFQTNFLPDFIQTYLIPEESDIAPFLEQDFPGFVAAFTGLAIEIQIRRSEINNDVFLFMCLIHILYEKPLYK